MNQGSVLSVINQVCGGKKYMFMNMTLISRFKYQNYKAGTIVYELIPYSHQYRILKGALIERKTPDHMKHNMF